MKQDYRTQDEIPGTFAHFMTNTIPGVCISLFITYKVFVWIGLYFFGYDIGELE